MRETEERGRSLKVGRERYWKSGERDGGVGEKVGEIWSERVGREGQEWEFGEREVRKGKE